MILKVGGNEDCVFSYFFNIIITLISKERDEHDLSFCILNVIITRTVSCS